jgi:hypothetical protein
MMIELTREYMDDLNKIIDQKNEKKATEILGSLHPADIAELYKDLMLKEAIYLYLLLDGDNDAVIRLGGDGGDVGLLDSFNSVLDLPQTAVGGEDGDVALSRRRHWTDRFDRVPTNCE